MYLTLKKICVFLAFSFLNPTFAFAQFVDNGGSVGSVDTAPFGQSEDFQNVTTKFDGVRFQVKNLVWEDRQELVLRMVAVLENEEGADQLFLLRIDLSPKLIDDLGNSYMLVGGSRFGVCSELWMQKHQNTCYSDHNATRLPPKGRSTMMFIFRPDLESGFNMDLEKLASRMQLSLALNYTAGSFEKEADTRTASIVIDGIPKPSPTQN
jgi:hypothetical protein